MVKSLSLTLLLTLVIVARISASPQEESGLSLIESIWANTEAIENYDVSYKHWQGFEASALPSKNFSKPTECLTKGRLVVDRKGEAILLIRDVTFESATGQQRWFECLSWRKGLETAFTKARPRPSNRKVDFLQFHATRLIPIVEWSINVFPVTLANETLEQMHQSHTVYFHNSKCIHHPDGSSTVFAKRESTRWQSQIKFDPVSAMPTSYVVSEFDPTTNVVVRELASGRPRYEKCKEVYRLVSINYDDLEGVGDGSMVKEVSTCELFWHQFNEDSIQFPDEAGIPFGVDDADTFLRRGIEEHVK